MPTSYITLDTMLFNSMYSSRDTPDVGESRGEAGIINLGDKRIFIRATEGLVPPISKHVNIVLYIAILAYLLTPRSVT